jgi:phage shock protein PspC (stress-responsive transcriptional regulator)
MYQDCDIVATRLRNRVARFFPGEANVLWEGEMNMKESLSRSSSDKVLTGVCGGLARSLGWSPLLVRILFVVLSLLIGLPSVAYVVMWLMLPADGNGLTGLEELQGKGKANQA